MENHKGAARGCFDSLDSNTKNFVMECVAHFHYRNGRHNLDGSMGEIKITPRQFNNILAYVIKDTNEKNSAPDKG